MRTPVPIIFNKCALNRRLGLNAPGRERHISVTARHVSIKGFPYVKVIAHKSPYFATEAWDRYTVIHRVCLAMIGSSRGPNIDECLWIARSVLRERTRPVILGTIARWRAGHRVKKTAPAKFRFRTRL